MRTSHFYCVGDTEARLSQRSRRRRVGLKWAAGTSSLTLELSWLQLHSGGHHVAHRLKPLPERGGEQRLRHLTRCEHTVHAPRGEAEQGTRYTHHAGKLSRARVATAWTSCSSPTA